MNDEQRIIEIIEQYWNGKKPGGNLPFAEAINSAELGEVWQSCFLIDFTADKFTYSFIGDKVTEAYAINLEGESVVEDPLYPESPELPHKLLEAINSSEPVIYEGALINRDNNDIKFQKILVPFARNGKVCTILGAMRWRAF